VIARGLWLPYPLALLGKDIINPLPLCE
jgi:hypothetical protein